MDTNLDHILKQFQNELTKQETSSKFSNYKRDGQYNDVPTTDDDDDYKTHIAVPFTEAEEEVPEEEVPEEEAAPPEGDMPAEGDMEAEPEMGAEGMPGEEGMDTGMPGEEDEGPKDKEEVGQAYEMKKIYSRLVSIEQYLNTATDETLIEIRNRISQAIELFRAVISNFDLYKEKIDDIIVQYYKFIDQVYELISKHMKNAKNKGI